MAINISTNENFYGGAGTDKKVGIKHAFANSQSIDFRKSPSQFTLLGKPVREDNGAVTDLVQNEVMINTGMMYSLGSTGNIYTRTNAGVWGRFGSIPNASFGMTYRQDQDSLYIAGTKAVSSITTIAAKPTLNSEYYNISQSTYNNNDNTPGLNVNADQSDGGLTSSVPTTAADNSQVRYFQTDIEPINKIGVQVAAPGTGDWTLTIQDGLNNTLATATITNANLIKNDWNYFVFSAQVRVSVAPAAQTYHWSLVSTQSDGTIFSENSNDISTANMQLWADRLVATSNGMHPMAQIQQFVVIGNGRYLSVWEPLGDPSPDNSEWQRHYLQFPPEWEVCGIAQMNEYIAIACGKVSTDPTQDPQDGIIFWWDGLQVNKYNYFTPIPEGTPFAIHSYKNVIYYEAGGSWYAISAVDSQPQKIRLLPFGENGYNNSNNQTIIYPYAAATRNGIQLLAWPSLTNNTNIPYGVYSWGLTDTTLTNSFGYSYLLSTGSTNWSNANNLTIGMVRNFGDTLHISWRDDSNKTGHYGVDVVNSQSPIASYATWESLIHDNGYVGKLKEGLYVNATWLPLPDGVRVRLKYSINRGDWKYSDYYSNSSPWFSGNTATYASFSIGQSDNQSRYNEIQVGIDVYCDNNVFLTPTVTSVTLVFDDLRDEALNNG